MVPESILQQLRRLRWRERGLRLVWGLCRFVAIALAILVLACFTDWWIDRRQETPGLLRLSMLVLQVALWAGLAFVVLLCPLARRMSDSNLALWVESRLPQFGHRLISAVQLNRLGADTQGMSPEMITVVTREAEERAADVEFTHLSDGRRWKWGLALVVPILLLALACLVAAPQVSLVLLARQFLGDREIPRDVALRGLSPRIWPSGEEVELQFEVVTKRSSPELVGEVCIDPVGRTSERYPLAWNTARGYFTAKIPPGATNFTYRAWLGDGRTREVGEVHYVPRPAIVRQDAWVLLPAYCGTRPNGQPYEQAQPRAEIVGYEQGQARVAVAFDKPIVRGAVLLFNRPGPEILALCQPLGLAATLSPGALPADALALAFSGWAARPTPASLPPLRRGGGGGDGRERLGPEFPCRQIPLTLSEDATSSEAIFDLRPEETAYRIRITDENGFDNARPTRRTVMVVPDEPPQVALLPERFVSPGEQGLAEDVEVENMPLPIGEAIQIGYYCRDALGLDRAELRYRVNDGPWRRLPLREIAVHERLGPFDPRRGTFAKASDREQVYFHAMPSPAPELSPPRLEGGGHFDFQTRALPSIKVGDHIEFYLEVYDRHPDPNRSPGRSDVRRKTVVTQQQFKDWVYQTLQHERRIRELEQKQRGVFDRDKK